MQLTRYDFQELVTPTWVGESEAGPSCYMNILSVRPKLHKGFRSNSESGLSNAICRVIWGSSGPMQALCLPCQIRQFFWQLHSVTASETAFSILTAVKT